MLEINSSRCYYSIAWVTYLGSLSHLTATLIPRISAHPPSLAHCKVHHSWALFCKGTVVDMVCELRREIKNLLALVQVVHVGGSSKVFACVLGSITCVFYLCVQCTYCSNVHKAMHIDFGTCIPALSTFYFQPVYNINTILPKMNLDLPAEIIKVDASH